jgi:hypothetical protein
LELGRGAVVSSIMSFGALAGVATSALLAPFMASAPVFMPHTGLGVSSNQDESGVVPQSTPVIVTGNSSSQPFAGHWGGGCAQASRSFRAAE